MERGEKDAPGRARVRHDVAADRLPRVVRRARRVVDARDDLVRHDDGDAKLVGEAQQAAQELGEVHLARRELAAARVVGAVQRRDRVDDDEREAATQTRCESVSEEVGK